MGVRASTACPTLTVSLNQDQPNALVLKTAKTYVYYFFIFATDQWCYSFQVPGARCENGVCKVTSENLSCQSGESTSDTKRGQMPCEESSSALTHQISHLGKLCPVNVCKYDGICVLNDASAIQCICQFNCSSSSHNGMQVCGNDARMYNECKFREEMCLRQQEIEPAESIHCEKYRNIPCEGEPPLVDESTRKEYNCSEESCPENSYCHRGLGFAKCCRELDLDENCYDSSHG